MDSIADNRDAVLRCLRRGGPTSKPALADLLHVSLPTIGKLVGLLTQEGLVAEVGQAGSTGGRRPVLIGLNPDAGHLIGATLSTRRLTAARFDLTGQRAGDVFEVELPPGGPGEFLDQIVEALASLADAPGGRLGGIGLGVSGVIDRENGACRYLFGRTDQGTLPIGDPLSARLGVPVSVVNDVYAATLTEQHFGIGRECEDFLYLHVGRGVGLGVVVGGRLLGGSHGHGGELGHTLADPAGGVCYCGNYGCLESVAGPPAIVRQALAAIDQGVQSSIAALPMGRPVSIEAIFTAADAGDRLACNLLEQSGEHLAVAVANAANVLAPMRLVLGGRLVGAPAILIETIQRVFAARRLPLLSGECHVVVSTLGADAARRGAAEVIFERAILSGPAPAIRRKHA